MLAILYVALPFDLMATSFLDTRIAIMLGFLLFAAVDPVRLPRRSGWRRHRADRAVCGAHGSCGGGLDGTPARPRRPPDRHRGCTTRGLGRHDQRAAGGGAGILEAGPRSRLISNGLRTEYHMPALLIIERGAFWPLLFANPAQQPILLRPPTTGSPARRTTSPPMPHWRPIRTADRLSCATSITF